MKKYSVSINCLFSVIFWSARLFAEYSYRDDYNETCTHNSQCPNSMLCNKDALCVCDVGLSFSHLLSKCERARKNFTDFEVQGPSVVKLPIGKVELKAVVREKWKSVNWTYSWRVLSGIDNARFVGLDDPLMTLTELKSGSIQVALSVLNDNSAGFMLHELIIADEKDQSVRIVDCDKQTKADSVRLWLPRDNKLRLCTVADKAVFYKWVRVDHSLRPIDISGSTSSVLELSNFQMANESIPYEFILSVSFEDGHSYNSTVKIFAHEHPKIPVISVQNVTVNSRADSVMLKAEISNESKNVFENFTWMQTDGPSRVDLANRHSLSLASIVGPLNASGLYSFLVRGITIAEDVAEAVLFVNVIPVEEHSHSGPVEPSHNFSVVLPKKFVFLKSNHCRNGDLFEWEPEPRVPAVMLLQSNFNSQRLFLGHLLPGTFTFRLFCYGQLKNVSTIVQLEVKRGNEYARLSLILSIRHEQTDDESFSVREQRDLLKTMGENLQRTMLQVDNVFYDGGGILLLRVTIANLSNSDRRMKKLTAETKMASTLKKNKTFLEQFKIISVSPTATCHRCKYRRFSTSGFLSRFFPFNDWDIIYCWIPIIVVSGFFFKCLHFFWKFQEERKMAEEFELIFCKISGKFVPYKGRFSPIPSLRKSKDNLVNRALSNENSETLLDDELSESTSNYEDEEEEEEEFA